LTVIDSKIMSASTVLLTGASGFVALHVLDALLSQGYNVVAAVRSPSREGDVRTVAKSYPNSKVSFVYVPDISADGAYDGVFKTHNNIKAVIHTASPVNFSSEDLIKDVVEPAINGTTNLLKAVKAYGSQVKRVAVTSSTVTVDNVEKPSPKGTVINENTWLDVSLEDAKGGQWIAYTVSKVLAEKALWKFVKEESPNFEVTTLLPAFVFGPLLGDVKSADALNESSGYLHKMVTGQIPQGFAGDYVDARDNAKAHVLAIEKPQLAGKRVLVTPGPFVAKKFVEASQSFGLGVQPDSEVDVEEILAQRYTIDNSASVQDLGFEFTSMERTVSDTVKSFLEKGVLVAQN
jgi:nucleoside-diphosphate-sugar epimerase